MPHEYAEPDHHLHALLDLVCQRYAMATREEAMTFLIKRRLRRCAIQVSGQGRRLELIRHREMP